MQPDRFHGQARDARKKRPGGLGTPTGRRAWKGVSLAAGVIDHGRGLSSLGPGARHEGNIGRALKRETGAVENGRQDARSGRRGMDESWSICRFAELQCAGGDAPQWSTGSGRAANWATPACQCMRALRCWHVSGGGWLVLPLDTAAEVEQSRQQPGGGEIGSGETAGCRRARQRLAVCWQRAGSGRVEGKVVTGGGGGGGCSGRKTLPACMQGPRQKRASPAAATHGPARPPSWA